MAALELFVVHQGALGDFVAIFPALLRLKRYYNRIEVLCQNQLGILAKELSIVDRYHPQEGALAASLFAVQIEPKMVDLLKSFAAIVLFSNSSQLERTIRRVTGKPCYRIPPKPPAQKPIHVTEFALNKLVKQGLLSKADLNPLSINDRHPGEDENHQTRNVKKILLHPGSGSRRKRWPMALFIKIESMLKSNTLEPEFIVGPAEQDLVKTLLNPQHPERTVHELIEIVDLLALLKSAGGDIGNDSGVSHLAAFLGLPTAVIFGPADPRRWQPLGRAVEVVRPLLECQPCFETQKENCEKPRCLKDTQSENVIDAFYRVYKSFA